VGVGVLASGALALAFERRGPRAARPLPSAPPTAPRMPSTREAT